MGIGLDFRKPPCVVVKEEVSWSGKYKIFFGHHFPKGKKCFDVGAINKETGEITTRHYNETRFDQADVQAKAEALRVYDELSQGMRRKPQSEETDDSIFKSDAYRRSLKQYSN